jgi:hypothetical protein
MEELNKELIQHLTSILREYKVDLSALEEIDCEIVICDDRRCFGYYRLCYETGDNFYIPFVFLKDAPSTTIQLEAIIDKEQEIYPFDIEILKEYGEAIEAISNKPVKTEAITSVPVTHAINFFERPFTIESSVKQSNAKFAGLDETLKRSFANKIARERIKTKCERIEREIGRAYLKGDKKEVIKQLIRRYEEWGCPSITKIRIKKRASFRDIANDILLNVNNFDDLYKMAGRYIIENDEVSALVVKIVYDHIKKELNEKIGHDLTLTKEAFYGYPMPMMPYQGGGGGGGGLGHILLGIGIGGLVATGLALAHHYLSKNVPEYKEFTGKIVDKIKGFFGGEGKGEKRKTEEDAISIKEAEKNRKSEVDKSFNELLKEENKDTLDFKEKAIQHLTEHADVLSPEELKKRAEKLKLSDEDVNKVINNIKSKVNKNDYSSENIANFYKYKDYLDKETREEYLKNIHQNANWEEFVSAMSKVENSKAHNEMQKHLKEIVKNQKDKITLDDLVNRRKQSTHKETREAIDNILIENYEHFGKHISNIKDLDKLTELHNAIGHLPKYDAHIKDAVLGIMEKEYDLEKLKDSDKFAEFLKAIEKLNPEIKKHVLQKGYGLQEEDIEHLTTLATGGAKSTDSKKKIIKHFEERLSLWERMLPYSKSKNKLFFEAVKAYLKEK